MRNNVSDTDHKLACPPPPSLARGLVAGAVLALSAVGVLSGCGGGSSPSSTDTNPSSGTPAPAPIPAPAPAPTASGPETEPELPPTTAPSPSTGTLPSGGGTLSPPLPPTLQLPSGVDLSKPGATIQGVKATSSAVENNNNGPDKAVDGSLTTRWASTQDDAAWIQFDFGAKTALGYMQLVWENAYGKEYAILASDDGQTWYQLRYVAGGKGGTEEFFNLNANVRYVKIQGVARATQYGYSLFEVSFKSPGSDNTLAAVTTSALPTPPVGATIMTPAIPAPLEQVQFTLPDGTLVTRFGFVGRSRHARERGEDWAEIGYGTNDTVDANGKPRDKGPGAYLNFIANYFKNRTWGVEFIDNSRVAGVTKPRIIINQYYQQAQRGGGHSFFRRFDDPGVTGYGWMSPGQLLDPTTYTDGFKDLTSCPVVPKPPEGALLKPNTGYNGVIGANDGCSVVLDNVPGHRDVGPDANGVLVPTTTVASRSLKVGDAIEFTGSFFSSRAAMDAIGDNGNFRYYTNEVTYVVGSGLRPWYGVQPRLMNAPLPEETLLGGTGSISYDYADNATFMFQQPSTQIGMQNMQRFTEGRRWIHTNMWTGDHNEAGNDRNTAAVGLQGPRFNQSTCFACHINNGRGLAPQVLNQRLDTMAVRTAALDANGKQVPHPTYGLAVQMNARSQTTGALQDWGMSVRVAGFDTKTVTLADGTAVTLSKPRVAFDGPTPSVYSLRAAQPMIGMGLLEAIPDADILARVRSTPDEDGVKGQANLVYDPETGAVRVGRYGWKAAKVSLRHQSANAALLDMSVTSPLYPNRDCLAGPAKCDKNKVEKGLSEADLQLITRYVALLGVPAQRSVTSGFPKGVTPLPYLDVNPTEVAAGAKVFSSIRCTACHVAEMKTGLGTELTENRNQTIRPYTDLLLHDMGADLADNLVESQAAGNQWRTSPLWGIGYTEYVAGTGVKVGYLHDSRASTLTEAILWHGGEATASRQRFINLSTADRKALMAFLNSL